MLLRLMGEDINYDSFGFIVIRLMYVGVGYRGRRVCARAKFSDYRHKCILMSDQRVSPIAFLISIAYISFLLLISSYGLSGSQSATRLRLCFHRMDCPLSRSSFSAPLSPALASFPATILHRFSFLSIRNSVLYVNIVRQSKDTWRALLRRSRF